MVDRVRVEWSGFPGGPGVSTFYVTDGTAAVGPLSTFFGAIRTAIPTDVSINIPALGDKIDPITGLVTGSWAGGTPTPTTGGGVGAYSAPAGAMIKWLTGGIARGHRVKGRTFLVPLLGGMFAADGTLGPDTVIMLQNAATALVSSLATNQFIWSRPALATPQWTDVHGKVHLARAAHVGSVYVVTAGQAVDKSVVLRSRRD